jgi:hypothetical protein
VVTVTVNPLINVVETKKSTCFGSDNGSISIVVLNNPISQVLYLFSWTGPNGFTSTSANITNLKPGAYTSAG